MSLVTSKKERKELDRLLIERNLAIKIAADIPEYYERLRGIVMEGEDTDSLKAALALFDRVLGKVRNPNEQPERAIMINVFNPGGGDVKDYKISRYGKNLGDCEDSYSEDTEPILVDSPPLDKTPSISSLPDVFSSEINTPPPVEKNV